MYSPKFTITPQITSCIAEIEGIRTVVDQSRILPEKLIALRHRATVEAIHSSTTIEGNPLNKQQVGAVLSGKAVTQDESVVLEVTNYKQALDWFERRKKSSAPLTIRDVLKLHQLTMKGLLPKEKVGKLRPGPVYIIDILGKKEYVRYTGPAATKLKGLLSELFQWLTTEADQLHPILAAGVLHYEFVSIHPFSDGNGRVTRLLTILYLSQRGYDFRGVLVPETYYLEHPLAYYDALSRAETYLKRRVADITPWIQYFTNGVLSVAKKLKVDITVAEVSSRDKKIIRLSQQEILMLSYVKQMGSISLEESLEILDVPRRTAQRRLKQLVEKKLLLLKGSGKNTFYILPTTR